jgi:predicted phosphodiesterase
MRIAVISDVHGGLCALEALISDLQRQSPDVVIHGGDLALMGGQPGEVVDRIRELGWAGVVGNTDALLWHADARDEQVRKAPKLERLLKLLFDEYAPRTRAMLGEERIAWLKRLPEQHSEAELLVLHAAPGDLWRAPMPDATDGEFDRTYQQLGAATVVYGHIHRPFVRSTSALTVANSGSVSLPWDGDPRASYLLIDGSRREIVRVPYDVERDAATLVSSGYPDAPRLAEMRRLGRFLPP